MITAAEINALPLVLKSYGGHPHARGARERNERASKNPYVNVRFPPGMFKTLAALSEESGLAFGEIVRRLTMKSLNE